LDRATGSWTWKASTTVEGGVRMEGELDGKKGLTVRMTQ
jgi:hypothetical protein